METGVRECESRWDTSMKMKMLGNKWCVKAKKRPWVEDNEVKGKIGTKRT